MEEQNNIPYDPEQDVNIINEALKGGKETDGTIIDIICSRSSEERQELIEKYKASYGENLPEKIDSKLSGGDLRSLIKGLMKPTVDYLTEEIYLSMKGAGTDEETLNEMIMTRQSSEMEKIVDRYPQLYKETLTDAIKGDTSNEYQKILIALISGKRSENPYPNTKKMKEVVSEIRGGKDGAFDTEKLVKYFANASFGEICTICRLYEKMYQKPLYDDIDKELGGDFKDLLKMMLVYISDSGRFFAEIINKFKDKSLIRIMITRSEIDMDDIRDAYKDFYKKDLIDEIKEKISNENYCKALTILASK